MTNSCDESPKPTCRTCYNWWPNFYTANCQWHFKPEDYEQENPCLGLKTSMSDCLEHTEPDYTCEGWEKMI